MALSENRERSTGSSANHHAIIQQGRRAVQTRAGRKFILSGP
jgi:hypothetical protein